MEFPDLGQQCSIDSCKQLDFLPVKCDACHNIFWPKRLLLKPKYIASIGATFLYHNHFRYAEHNCTESYSKDNQVPVCPLCNTPIPVKKGELPDVRVGEHIDNDCQSDPAKEKRKIYTNRCALKGCKQKELIPFKCDRCHQNFCLRHRLEADHTCQGFEQSGRGVSHSGAAAAVRSRAPVKAGSSSAGRHSAPQTSAMTAIGRDLNRERQQRQNNAINPRALQAGMSEDEAMARAIAMSLQTSDTPPANPSNEATAQEEADLALARALQESEREAARARPTRQQSTKERTCALS